MEERLIRLEAALEELREENGRLRRDLEELRCKVITEPEETMAAGSDTPPRRRWRYWSVVVLVISLILVPVLAFTVGHMSAFWSTTLAAANGLVLYIVGPGVWKLLIDGLIRAIPGILLGQTTRIAVDRWRSRISK